ncbi:MAG TPA: hypothetical protein DC047_18000 [Blastocatellia bacterium]|nr:hypothetical protein [Blastocatellia bacterium]
MLPINIQPSDSEDILKALGQLALAASQAEACAAQGLYFLLTDAPGDEEGAARISAEFRSFASVHRLLSIALRCEIPLIEILNVAKSDSEKRDAQGDPVLVAVLAGVASRVGDSQYLANYALQTPGGTAVDYLNKVKALYDKRNECLHALGIEAAGIEAHLYKRKKDGTKTILSALYLMEHCTQLRHYPGITLASAIEGLSLELSRASLDLVLLPITLQWFRRRGTALDLAPLVDHYVGVAVQPLDQQIALLKEAATILEAKLGAYRAAHPVDSEVNEMNS